MLGIGFNNGLFNIEFFYNPKTDDIKIIEINPRMASQLAYLYEAVDGVNPYRMALDLALGDAPRVERAATAYRHAASFALRKFDGKPLTAERKTYMLLYKPTGYLTTYRDPQGRPTIFDLLPQRERYLFPVGRLDLDTSGLLLLTNDSAFAERVTNPDCASIVCEK